MKRTALLTLAASAMLSLSALQARAETFSFDFETGFQGWQCDFADYPAVDSMRFKLTYGRNTMKDIKPVQYGITMSGDNFSDDLFFFLKHKITELVPNARYAVAYSIDIVTEMPPDGLGGSDLMLKAGATSIEPAKTSQSGMFRMNIDKANQSQPGKDMDTLGRTHHSVPSDFTYRLVTFSNASRIFRGAANASGELWLIVGAESSFEAYSEFNVAKVTVTVSPETGVAGPPRSKNPSTIEQTYLYSLSGKKVPLESGAGPGLKPSHLSTGAYLIRNVSGSGAAIKPVGIIGR